MNKLGTRRLVGEMLKRGKTVRIYMSRISYDFDCSHSAWTHMSPRSETIIDFNFNNQTHGNVFDPDTLPM